MGFLWALVCKPEFPQICSRLYGPVGWPPVPTLELRDWWSHVWARPSGFPTLGPSRNTSHITYKPYLNNINSRKIGKMQVMVKSGGHHRVPISKKFSGSVCQLFTPYELTSYLLYYLVHQISVIPGSTKVHSAGSIQNETKQWSNSYFCPQRAPI